MSLHGMGTGIYCGGAILLAGWTWTAKLAVCFMVVVFAIVWGSIIWGVIDQNRRRRRAGQSPEQFIQAAEQLAAERLRKEEDEWTLPPELSGPTPRSLTPAPLAFRLLRTLPRLIFLTALALMVYSFWNPYLRAAPAQSINELWAFQMRALREFLQAPQWHAWMLWPTAVLVGFAVLTFLPGYFQSRRTKRLLMYGTPARAVINSFAGGRGGVWWHLEYPDADGNVIKTSLLRHSNPDAGHSVLTVLYDPAKPHDLITYPVPQYRVSAS